MKIISEINELITIRSFLRETINNSFASKDDVRYAQKTLPIIENKIFSLLSNESFKQYIDLKK